MNIFNFRQRSSETPPPPPNILHQTLSNFQTEFNSVLSHAKVALETSLSKLPFKSSPKQDIIWARIGDTNSRRSRRSSLSLPDEIIGKRLAGVPVYALCDSSSEIVLMTNEDSGKSIGLFCMKQENADTLLNYMKSVDENFRPGTRIVPVSLSKVIQLQANGIAFRLLPEPSQVKNALEERQKVGVPDRGFSGVPVFQSTNLLLKYQDKEFRPVFLRKEDLEKSLKRAADKQQNPASVYESIEVAALEDIIKGMKDNFSAKWNDVVFIPPGLDFSAGSSELQGGQGI